MKVNCVVYNLYTGSIKNFKYSKCAERYIIIKFTKGGAIAGALNFLASGFLYFIMMFNYWNFKRNMLKNSQNK